MSQGADMIPSVVMRSHNDMPLIMDTLKALRDQTIHHTLICLDNDSDDGTTQELRKHTDLVINIPKGTYVPGKVLNLGMKLAQSQWVVFLNSDCVPCNPSWLANLLSITNGDSRLAAVFGRQVPRRDCSPLFAKDTEETYGDGSRQKYWKHCFSMASSAVSRSVWESMNFNEDIQYSEDIEWTWRARQQGYRIHYIPESVVEHSHNYTLKQFYKRQYGEGKAEAAIFSWSKWEASLLRYSLMPYVRQVLSDWKYCLPKGLLPSAAFSVLLRCAQMLGRRRGFKEGIAEKLS
jgi:rhamnosyltransferase